MEDQNIFVQESWVNATEGHRSGDSDVYESYTDDTGELFRSFQKEYGRCTGKVYIDTDDGVKAIGWVFQKWEQYDRSNETFLLETWITLHEKPETRRVEYHYLSL